MTAYRQGASDAFAAFGVRVASELLQQSMPDGPDRLGAERLARLLKGRDEGRTGPTRPEPGPIQRRLNRSTSWGPQTVFEATDNRDSYPGIGVYQGV